MRGNFAIRCVLILIVLSPINTNAQILLTSSVDVGENVLMNSPYYSCSMIPAYYVGKLKIESGIEWAFISKKDKKFNGFSLLADYSFKMLSKPISATAFAFRNIISNNLRSTNLGVLLNSSYRHFDFKLGNNYRKYQLLQTYQQNSESAGNDRVIIEPWNLVYSLTYNVNKTNKCWNLGITITDYDNHSLAQETNPLIHVKGSYSLNDDILPFVLIGYKTAGLLNLRVNYFGYYFRMGLLWRLLK